ncbi:alpha-(1-_3)-arabinofuranosyltransferase domain-containing protein [Leekyejoonella antrihumi]|uniref:DUF3367 domain-containing protein n=1 Tax=Leekyejoonella antrihumi TaxID=1660198 RepID=A0A563E3N5_9MICO|nr:alpha-(1->3)-arabinofuranosyltransferase family protein [Leekyejoonella antrihumi]TWP37127.1 DUF3367 domain-containing protein [Leekyejoonella antrihumi]
MRRHVTTFRSTVAGLSVLLALIVALNGLGSFYTDVKPEVYLAPWHMFGQYLSAWTATPYLGSASYNVGLVPVLLVTGALRGVGLSPEWAFKVFHFTLWMLAAWGAARLLRALTSRAGRWAGLAVGVLYLANPYSVQAGSTLAILLPYALFPWLLIAFVRALRQSGGWRAWRCWVWPAVFGLVFFAMSGMNVAVVPIFELVALIPLMIFARLDWGMSWRHILGVLARCALFVIGVSIYWLVPSAAALSHGTQIVNTSETISSIAQVSSFTEVLRGLGMWPLYGQGSGAAWVPEDAVYVTSPMIIMLTMLWPTLGLVALRWCRGLLRGLVTALVAVAAVVMVGAFPSENDPASPFGHLLVWFLHLPGMGAFRTTNKIGALLALGFALAIGAAAVRLGPRLMRRDGATPVVWAVGFSLLFAWTLPALTNRLYTSQMDVPGYWHQAADALNQGNPQSSVLFLPGQVAPSYRWTAQRPDDVANSLLTRTAIIPETTPNASAPGGNFLMSMDDTLQDGVVPPSTISDYARYLGSDQILLRHDTNWEDAGGARPAATSQTLSNDPGLRGQANYGSPGEFVSNGVPDGYSEQESLLPPLQVYQVKDATTSVRAEATKNSLLVAGDGWAVPEMSAAGLLKGTPTFQYAQNVPAGGVSSYLGGQHTLVLTDTNARRAAIPNRLTAGEGALLTANQSAPDMRTLGTNPEDQTVLVRSGATVSATSEGSAFFAMPYGVPANALDDDPQSAWLFGDFHRAAGQVLTIHEPSPVTFDKIRIAQTSSGASKIGNVTVRVGHKTVTQQLPDSGYATFDIGGVSASTVTATIDSQRGGGGNLVGIRDIQMAGPRAVGTARTPTTFDQRYQAMSPAEKARFDETPLDVLLSRVQNTPSPGDDTETGLRRLVSLPDQRTFTTAATARVDGSLEQAYDDVAGLPRSITATSSDFYFHLADERASMAADGKPGTAWVPGGPMKGAWWQLAGPTRTIRAVTIDQQHGPGDTSGKNTLWAQRVSVSIDGKKVTSGDVKPGGKTTLHFPAHTGKTVRVTIDRISGPLKGVPARFVSIATGLTMKPTTPGPQDAVTGSDRRCLTVATVDGQPVRMRPTTSQLAGADDQGTSWVGCGTLTLQAGERRIEQAPGFTVDSLAFTDVQSKTSAAPTAPVYRVTHDGSSAKTISLTSQGSAAVVISQSYDPRWQATANGKDLGPPQIIDGYSVGWILPKAGHYTVKIRYTPQTTANVAIGISLATLLLAVFLIVMGGVRRTIFDLDAVPDERDQPVAGLLPGLPRTVTELVLVLLAAFTVGWAGLVAAVAMVALLRWRRVPSWWLQVAGAALVLASAVVYLLVLGDLRGQVSAYGVYKSMWPHYLAGAGLVIALTGALRGRGRPRGSRGQHSTQEDHNE